VATAATLLLAVSALAQDSKTVLHTLSGDSDSYALAHSSQGSSPRAVPLIVELIDESKRIVLPGSIRGEVRRTEFDRGAVDDSFPLNGMQLQLRRSPEHEQAAEDLADDLERAGSPRFHQWLTAEQYAEQFGVAPEDIAKISNWLNSHGFTVQASPSRMTIDFSGTAAQVRATFGTEIHALHVKGVRHIANVGNPSIPAALAPAIEGIVSLNDFRPRKAVVAKPAFDMTLACCTGTFYAVVPADLATIYNFNPLFSAGITGQGQTIALIEDSDAYTANDWVTFRKTFGLDVYRGASLATVHPGGCPDPGVNGDDLEAMVDVEYASAAAPGANLILATCASTATVDGGLQAIQNLVNQRHVPPIISYSYGYCEALNGPTANAAYKAAFLQAVLEGVSVFVATADGGADVCDWNNGIAPAISGVSVNALASTAYNVAVGGTDFGDTYLGTNANYWSQTNSRAYGSALSYIPEIPWDLTCASALLSSYEGYATPYGPNGFCNSSLGESLLEYGYYAGGGGPSNCATGASIIEGNGATPSNGTCRGWEKPIWQNVVGNPQDGVRDLPDVSLFSSGGAWGHFYVFCYSDLANGGAPCVGSPSNWTLAGGTSFATPIMAGTQALVNQVWGGRQGNPDPIYYALARREYGGQDKAACQSVAAGGPAAYCTFYDITLGDNDIPCTGPYNCYDPDASAGVIGVLSLSNNSYQPAFKAGVGWDFATGIGSVNATNLVLDPIWWKGWLPWAGSESPDQQRFNLGRSPVRGSKNLTSHRIAE